MNSKDEHNFTVITNNDLLTKEKHRSNYEIETDKHVYQTNPLKEKFLKFHNNEIGHKFSVEDLLKW